MSDNNREVLIKMKGIRKNFGYIKALDGCDFSVKKGEIAAIVGDNGSGKSTLMKILNGSLKPDGGAIFVDDKKYSSLNIKEAIKMGIQTVYQDLSLDNYKNCMENVFLGCEPTIAKLFIDRKTMKIKTRELLDKLDINISDLSIPVGYLSGGQRQAVAIARALNRNGKILILDEPTAAMGIRESSETLKTLKNLNSKNRDLTQIIIIHNLLQAFEIADSIHIMRSGRIIASVKTKDSSPLEVQDMILEKENEYDR